ncbi:hypothetical protein Acr_23g0010560 [Actinidia rufa]|uniref:Uncharacterized protein n=1 Tax=Actinidia rufa TaxID=165716 RepID=A0A7J0GPF7_9ERIC|nr:hypothetical protein Acr_23g0010560 [Actinidia rufa]
MLAVPLELWIGVIDELVRQLQPSFFVFLLHWFSLSLFTSTVDLCRFYLLFVFSVFFPPLVHEQSPLIRLFVLSPLVRVFPVFGSDPPLTSPAAQCTRYSLLPCQ